LIKLYVYALSLISKPKQPIMKNANKWALLENGYVHTDCLSKADAEEMLERYCRIFNDIEYCITYLG
jgi:hypothetical protein